MVKTPLEDFTTEIFAGILDNDQEIRNDFINKILKIEGDSFEISTQEIFLLNEENCPDCRVDLVIKSADTICFVENKVESREGYIQLERYGKVLDAYKFGYKTYLRYCTKYYDNKEFTFHDFSQFRWVEVYRFLKKWEHLAIINEYLEFLEDHNMSDNMNFDIKDLIAMQEINPLLKKMDSYFDKIKPTFNKIWGYRLKDISMIKQIKEHSRYIMIMDLPFGSGYSELGFGFAFSDAPHLTLWIWCSEKNSKSQDFKKALNSDNLGEIISNNENWMALNKPVTDFLSNDNMEIAIEEWFIRAFKAFKEFSESTPQLEWNTK